MDIHASVDAILTSDDVLGRTFYKSFLEHDLVRPYFAQTNLPRQAVLLTMALLVIEQSAEGDSPVADEYLRDLGARHASWGIPPELYETFREALLESLRKHLGDDWTAELAEQWSAAIGRSAKIMLEGYPQADA